MTVKPARKARRAGRLTLNGSLVGFVNWFLLISMAYAVGAYAFGWR